ncbi:MAG: SEC-C metal-binding domain-containing protein [Chlamydiota bacterium]
MTVGRNDPCPCGSGKKYKTCCLGKKRKINAKVMEAPSKVTSLMGRVSASTPPKKEGFEMTEKDYRVK